MSNAWRRRTAIACYALGSVGIAGMVGIAFLGLHQAQKMAREMDEWKEETQAKLFQAVADQQARGLLDFNDENEAGLGSVTPIRRDVGR